MTCLNPVTQLIMIRYFYGAPIYKKVIIGTATQQKVKTKFMGRITVAALFSTEENKLYLHHARCHPQENFCKDTGSSLALSRVFAGADRVIHCSREEVAKYAKQYASELEEYYINRMH